MLRLVLASLLWAPSFGLIRRELVGVDPDLVAGVRLGLGALVFAPFLRGVRRRDVLPGLALGAVQFGWMYALYIRAYRVLEGHEVALLTSTTPLWVLGLERVLGGRFGPRAWGAALLAVASAVVLVGGRPRDPGEVLRGVALVQAANLCFAAGQVAWRRRALRDPEASPTAHHALAYLGACAVLVPLVGGDGLEAAVFLMPDQWATLVYLGLVASALGFYLWNTGAQRVSAPRLAVLNDLKAPLAVVVSLLVFGERADPLRLAASVLGMLLALRLCRPADLAPSGPAGPVSA